MDLTPPIVSSQVGKVPTRGKVFFVSVAEATRPDRHELLVFAWQPWGTDSRGVGMNRKGAKNALAS